MRAHVLNWCVLCGGAFIVVGVVTVAAWPTLFHMHVKKLMVLTNGSMSFGIWQEIPIPVYMECFLFNISNVDDILAGGRVKPRLQQMGPYVFREYQEKVNIIWNANHTVSYQTRRVWHFQPDRSNGSLADLVTNINPIIPTIAYVLRHDTVALRMLVDIVMRMHHRNMFLTASAGAWLFDGIRDPILSFSSQIPGLPYTIPFDRFGWMYTRNGSSDYDSWFVVNTGAEEYSRLGQIERWNHGARTVYPGGCGDVRGSTGELWAPEQNQREISLFASDICTTMTLGATGPVTVLGIEGMMFSSNDSLFDNGQKYPNKACFCEMSPDDCTPSGALNVSACRYGAPAFVSLPHFLHVDPYYADKVDGLEPTEDHEFRMAVELVTGMPLLVLAQLQVNVLVRHSAGLSINNQFSEADLLVPMFWFRERVVVGGWYVRFARLAILLHRHLPHAVYVVIALGVMLLAAGLWNVEYRMRRRQLEAAEAETFLKQ